MFSTPLPITEFSANDACIILNDLISCMLYSIGGAIHTIEVLVATWYCLQEQHILS